MTQTIFATKKNMTQTWTKSGKRIPVTVVNPLTATVTQIKTKQKDGYSAIQVAIGEKKSKLINKPTKAHLKKSNKDLNPRYLREIRFESDEQIQDFQLGQEINPFETLNSGDKIKVTGISKGKGFAGVMKRHNFKGGPRTHGQSDRERAPGSIGQGTDPGRVWKGKKMAGRMGTDTKTIRNLMVVNLDTQNQEIWLKGSISGHFGSLITINKTGESNFEGLNLPADETSEEISQDQPKQTDSNQKPDQEEASSEAQTQAQPDQAQDQQPQENKSEK